MDEKFIRNRITELRIKKGVSEYKMSTEMGHSKSYIQSITSGRALPALSELLYMCEYLGVTPNEFFDDTVEEPILVHKITQNIQKMTEEDLQLVLALIERLNRKGCRQL